LAAGVALALKSQGVRIVGAQVEHVDAMAQTLRNGIERITPAATLADGVRVKQAGELTREILGRLLDDIVIVREAELRETLVRLALEEHVIAEGAGALALAAGRRVAGKRKCAVVSGGNIDAAVLAGLLADVRPRPPRKPRRRTKDEPFAATSTTLPNIESFAPRAAARAPSRSVARARAEGTPTDITSVVSIASIAPTPRFAPTPLPEECV